MATVVLDKLTKTFDGKVTAVDNVSLEIAEQEFMVVVGPSGCGKTTTLRLIAGLEDVTCGTITIDGTIVNNVAPKDRGIAMVFQNYALYPHMTVFQNMAFGLRLRKYPKEEIKRRVAETAELLGIDRLLERRPNAISGGQRQRVALGRAIVRNPKVFLFDEPLSNLDAKLRITTRAELKALHSKLKATSVYVTHDQGEAMTLGDRICVMNKGVVQQVASPVEVYDHPANKFVAGFFGTVPMNFFNGRIEFTDNAPCFIWGQNRIVMPMSMSNALGQYDGKEMILGVRPEDVWLKAFKGQRHNRIAATVRITESLGNMLTVYLDSIDGTQFIISVEPHTPIKAGDAVEMCIDAEKTHIFEPNCTGRRVNSFDA